MSEIQEYVLYKIKQRIDDKQEKLQKSIVKSQNLPLQSAISYWNGVHDELQDEIRFLQVIYNNLSSIKEGA